MAWLISTNEVPEAWPAHCIGCATADPQGTLKVYGERLKSTVTVTHVFERLCVELPWCERCAARTTALLMVGLGTIVLPWLVLLVLSFEPSVRHLVEPQTLVTGCVALNAGGMLLLAWRYWHTRPVRLLAGKQGVKGFVLRNPDVAAQLAHMNGLVAERVWLPRGW